MSQFLFVYGTLRNHEENEMALYLKERANYAGTGSIVAKLHDLGGYPGLILAGNFNDLVIGDIYEIKNEEVFAKLDFYENAWPLINENPEYVRKELFVTHNENKIKCWVYVYNESFV